MSRPRLPASTYRIQLNSRFTFDDAAALAPYFAELGVSHCYTSPYLRARAGSSHGYDIVDHNAFNPEIGDEASFDRFIQALERNGLGHILDLVPNHMGVFGNDNLWWLDLLENGPASPYAGYFDIDWTPLKADLHGRLLIPVLGDHYGTILENGELRLEFQAERGEFTVYYYSHQFPLDPRTYPRLLDFGIHRLEAVLGEEHEQVLEYKTLISSFGHLPARTETTPERVEERRRDKEIHKKHFAALCARSVEVSRFVRENVRIFNGEPGSYEAFNHLHFLLEEQAFRLAFWLVASDEINYRRFFDINDLAGLRMEEDVVFTATHRLVLKLIAEGRLDGLRIDHPDGLYDPLAYYRRLVREIARCTGEEPGTHPARYLVVEKILAAYEHLPEEWPVHGTTGYDFINLVNGLFVYGPAEHDLDHVYHRFAGQRPGFDDLLYNRRKLAIKVQLSSELNVLAVMLNDIAERNRHTRDFTLNGCRDAIRELVACFPVYRTYITEGRVSDEDRRYVEWALAKAKKRSPAADTSVFDFVRRILVEDVCLDDPNRRQRATRFTMRLQQYTAPVMAKALEDTTLYIHHRLVSLNEVGGDPRRFGTTVAAFHHANQERARRWPYSMTATSTHDTKRSEDVRARIDVLSECAAEWQKQILRWARLHRSRKALIEGNPAPSRNDEYLLYQTLVGTWPLVAMDNEALAAYRKRIREYMLKAVKEAKVHTSWINPNEAYEGAVVQFVDGVLSETNPALGEISAFISRIVRFGLYNSISQTVLRLTAPGMPDTYQGTELWNLSLVDPDNRAPVDYALRHRLLTELRDRLRRSTEADLVRELIDAVEDGRIKLYLIWRLLTLRRELAQLFLDGEYLPLEIAGTRAQHCCAFARHREGTFTIVATTRWYYGLLDGLGDVWDPRSLGDARVVLPRELAGRSLRDRFTGYEFTPSPCESGNIAISCADIFALLPTAVLTST